MLNFYCFSRTRRYIDGNRAIYRPFLVAVRNTAIGTPWGGAVIRMFDKTPATEKFPNLDPHCALSRTNTVSVKLRMCMEDALNECQSLPLM